MEPKTLYSLAEKEYDYQGVAVVRDAFQGKVRLRNVCIQTLRNVCIQTLGLTFHNILFPVVYTKFSTNQLERACFARIVGSP